MRRKNCRNNYQNNGRALVATVLLPGLAAVAVSSGCAGSRSAYEAEKVMVCHEGKTLVIPRNAVTEHLGHGDTRGPCE